MMAGSLFGRLVASQGSLPDTRGSHAFFHGTGIAHVRFCSAIDIVALYMRSTNTYPDDLRVGRV